MYRTPHRGQRSPAPPRPPGNFHSPGGGWGRSPYGQSPRGAPYYPPNSPGYMYGSPSGYNDRPRDFGGNRRRSGDSWRRPPPYRHVQSHSSDSIEKYYSPAMVQDPWEALQEAAPPPTPNTD